MPIIKTNQITIKAINDLHKHGKTDAMLLDGNNLYIKKNANSLTWYYRVVFKSNTGTKKTWLSLGNYPQTTILAARNKALNVKDLISRGINPILMQANNNDRLGKSFSLVLQEYQHEYFKAISKNTKRNYLNVVTPDVKMHHLKPNC